MSFILDALKKSETERQRADAPGLYEMKVAPARPRVAPWLIVLGALLLINIVVLSVVLLRGNHGTAPQLDANAPPASPAAPAPAMAPGANPPAPGAARAPDALPSAPATAGASGSAAPDSTAAGTNDDDAPAVDPARSAAASTASGEVPSYEQASSAPGANLPELKLDLHAYATNPADRFVFLNAVNLREGQTSPQGVRVEAITPEGAILSWHGTRFFLHSQ